MLFCVIYCYSSKNYEIYFSYYVTDFLYAKIYQTGRGFPSESALREGEHFLEIFIMNRFFRFAGALTAAWLLAAPAALLADVPVDDNTVIAEGVSALGIGLGGLTTAQAREQIDAYYGRIASSTLTVTFDDQSVSTTPGRLGMSWDAAEPAAQAAALGKSGSLITRYKSLTDLREDGREIPTVCSYDMSAVEDFVLQNIASRDALPQDASLIRNENREFVVTPDVHGMVTDVDHTVSLILERLYGNTTGEDVTIEADVEVAIPAVTTEMMSAVGDKLGTYHTDYSSSSSARKTNIRVAAERINGTILMPGETFSLSDTILSRTPENGYEMAPQYANGESEMAYGGGVCQVSTTLYNAVIRAELEILERHPHSMVVHYVPYSSDAAISEGNKDLKFRNNQDYPVYLASDADGEGLYFSVYGKETRPESRTVEFVSDTLYYKQNKTKVVKDPDLAEGKEKSKGSNHPEVNSTLTKIVYENGVEVSREVMNTDYYNGSQKIVYKGTKKKKK